MQFTADQEVLIYEGEFVNGLYHGKGRLNYQTEEPVPSIYEGEFKNGVACGYGKLTSIDEIYEVRQTKNK